MQTIDTAETATTAEIGVPHVVHVSTVRILSKRLPDFLYSRIYQAAFRITLFCTVC